MSMKTALLAILMIIGIIPAIYTEVPRQRATTHNTWPNNIIAQIQNELIQHVNTGLNGKSEQNRNGNIGKNDIDEPNGNGNIGKNDIDEPNGNGNTGKNGNSEPAGNGNLGFKDNSKRLSALTYNTRPNNIIDQIRNELIKYVKTQQGNIGKNGNGEPTGNGNIGKNGNSEPNGKGNIGNGNSNSELTRNLNIGKNGNGEPTENGNIGKNGNNEPNGNENRGYNDNSEPMENKNIEDNVISGTAEDGDEKQYTLTHQSIPSCPLGMAIYIVTRECVKPELSYKDTDYS